MKTQLPPGGDFVVFFVLFLSCLYLFSGIKERLRLRKQPTSNKRLKLERPKPGFGISMLFNQVALSFFLLATYTTGWNLDSVGLKLKIQPLISVTVGIICYAIFVIALNKFLQAMTVLATIEDANFLVMAKLMPRERLQKITFLFAVCLLNPITEELLFRGILVHQFGILLSLPLLAIAIGFLINLGNHIYQGIWQITTHLPFFIIAVVLLYSPFGLLGAIGFHIAGDAYPFMVLKRDAINYRKRQQGIGNRK